MKSRSAVPHSAGPCRTRHLALLSILTVLATVGATTPLRAAALHVVHDSAELQNALNVAATNDEDDIVLVANGIYTVASPLTYMSAEDEDRGLLIGGYTTYDRPVLSGGLASDIMLISAAPSYGAGRHARVVLDDLVFEMGSGPFGALVVATRGGSISISHCRFSGNQTTGTAGGVTAVSQGGPIRFVHNIVANNTGGVVGGAVLHTTGGALMAHNNTVIYNLGDERGGLLAAYLADPHALSDARSYIANNIVWGNTARSGAAEERDLLVFAQVDDDDDPVVAIRNNALGVGTSSWRFVYDASVHGPGYTPFASRGNLFGDPFVRLDYQLQPVSPCIDRGTDRLGEGTSLPGYDYFFAPRVVDGNGDGTAVVDIGASEYPATEGRGKRLYDYLPGKSAPQGGKGPITYLPFDGLVQSSDKTVGWRLSIRRTSAGNPRYALHYADPTETHYGPGVAPTWGKIVIPGIEVPAKADLAFGFNIYMDTREGDEQDVLRVLVNGQQVWQKTRQNLEMQAWQRIRVGLAEFQGQTVDVTILFDTVSSHSSQGEGVYIDGIFTLPVPEPKMVEVTGVFK